MENKKLLKNTKFVKNMAKTLKKINKQTKPNKFKKNKTLKLLAKEHDRLPVSYDFAIRNPEYAQGAKVPRQMSKETVALSRHLTITTAANVLGKLAILWSPFFLHDDAQLATTLMINNTATYDGVSVFGSGHMGIATPFQLPAGNVSAYRLVSACIHIVPQIPLTTSTGKIGGAVSDLLISQINTGVTTANYNNAATISAIEALRPYAESDICIPESLRLVWTPYDVNDLAMYDINENLGYGATAVRENVVMAYVTGAPASASFNIELFYNFEVTPIPGSILSGMGTFCADNTDPVAVLTAIKSNPKNLAHAYVSTQHYHGSYDTRSFSLSTTPRPPPSEADSLYAKYLNSVGGTVMRNIDKERRMREFERGFQM